jgi:uridine phosphorylase
VTHQEVDEMDQDELQRVAWRLEQRGIAGMERELHAVATAARRAGVRPVAAAVLDDREAPDVARMRAFGLVSMALVAASHDDAITPAA